MTTTRLPCIDWMKSFGMALIVQGHVGGVLTDHLTPPFNPKQLGVAFFLFVTGLSLARDRRPWVEVVFRRLFEVYLIGIVFALLMSMIGVARDGDPAESNFLPFLLGANVLLDFFPANPTTWFIGTYSHAVLLGAIALRHVRVRYWMFVPVALVEVLARALLMQNIGLFPAYMLLTNWVTVFLLGFYIGQNPDPERLGLRDLLSALALIALLAIVWPAVAWPGLDPQRSFPFMRLALGSALVSLGLTSACVTLLYVGYTWSIYRLALLLPSWIPIRFFARNTLFIFVAHMPVYYALQGPFRAAIPNYVTRVAILFLVNYVGLALASESLRRLIRPDRLRDRIWSNKLHSRQPAMLAAPTYIQLALEPEGHLLSHEDHTP